MAASRTLFEMMSETNQTENIYLKRLRSFSQETASQGAKSLISLFCGGGGLDLGLNLAGFSTKACSDLSPAFVNSVTANLPHAVGIPADAMQLTGDDLTKMAGSKKIDLMAAGPRVNPSAY